MDRWTSNHCRLKDDQQTGIFKSTTFPDCKRFYLQGGMKRKTLKIFVRYIYSRAFLIWSVWVGAGGLTESCWVWHLSKKKAIVRNQMTRKRKNGKCLLLKLQHAWCKCKYSTTEKPRVTSIRWVKSVLDRGSRPPDQMLRRGFEVVQTLFLK